MKTNVFCFVAYSSTGKTTFLEKLVSELGRRGLRVAVVKHDAHDFDIDREGKDSWRFTRSGADVVALISSKKAVIMENRPADFEDILGRLPHVDIILAEGYKASPYPKIAVFRAASGTPLAADPDACLAVVSDTPLATRAPLFALDDVCPLADFLLDAISWTGRAGDGF